jgi:hypothetical protein
MRGVVVGTGKRLDEAGQRLETLLASLVTSRDLQESKARLEEAQRVAPSATGYGTSIRIM